MLRPFFTIAMLAPARQLTFRRVAVGHALFLGLLAWVTAADGTPQGVSIFGYVSLIVAMVEGSALIGWRLTQLPKSQALEFLLVSPLQPKRVFAAEALVGLSRFALVWLGGLPVYLALIMCGAITGTDLWPLAVLPLIWGTASALILSAWVYETIVIRRIGEVCGIVGVLFYLTVGVLAGERLVQWLQNLPGSVAKVLYDAVIFFHEMNPFGVMRYWFGSDAIDWIAEERMTWLVLGGLTLCAVAGLRGASRLKGHFHDRHYKPIDSSRLSQIEAIGDRPLSWWAVRRVMEFSGRINMWLAGGFSILYSVYLVAGDEWPPWMGRLVFQLFDKWGGPPTVATAMVILAAVPAIFQYGLWDSTVQDRCKRLELLLLSDLTGRDYWLASRSAAWRRGRGYLIIACMLWVAMGISGYSTWVGVMASAVGGLSIWAFSFAVGFRSFATGNQTSGLSSFISLGLPLVLYGLLKFGHEDLAGLLPTGLCHLPAMNAWTWTWPVGLIGTLGLAYWLTRTGLAHCDRDLRAWYDANQGTKAAG